MTKRRLAAQYLRMSTEQQDYSIRLQVEAIAAYSARHEIEVVKSYVDEGISGLTIEKRPALRQLLSDVIAGNAGFEIVLVNDVSRLGRFQNPDEAAHYEYLFGAAGVGIQYCSEPFANDGSLTATLLKSIKRAMAAEYSRELSSKVAHAQLVLSTKGFWQGGPPGYGLRRQLVRPDGSLGRLLENGDRKGPHGGRTVLVHGPANEVETVRRIYKIYLAEGLGARTIARRLNAEGVPGPHGRWLPHLVHDILTNEKYAGTNVLRKTFRRLGGKSIRRDPATWTRTPDAFEPIVSRAVFQAAQSRRKRGRRTFTDEELIAGLKRLHAAHGTVSAGRISSAPDLPSAHVYTDRFGSLMAAYRRAELPLTWRHTTGSACMRRNRLSGSEPNPLTSESQDQVVERVQAILGRRGRLSKAIVDQELGRGAFSAAARKCGGARNLYRLAGYRPSAQQDGCLSRNR